MKISGHVDLCGPELIEGWLYCDAWEGEPIKLQVFVSGALLGECVAERFRSDLQEAGYGDGRCGFSFFVPDSLAASDFADTKLRLIDTPVFLLPDEFSNIARSAVLSSLEQSSAYPSPLGKEASGREAGSSSGKGRLSERTLHHTR